MDGLSVNVSFSFQYMLKDNIKEVVNLYEKYGEDFRKVFYHIAADVLGDVFSNYMTAQLFSDRAGKNFFHNL